MMSLGQQPVQIQSAPYQPTVYVIPTSTTSGRQENFAAKTGSLLARGQICLGSLCIIFNITSIVLGDNNSFKGLGILCGVLATVGGGLGVGASKNKTTCLIISFMVLSILAAVAAGFVILDTALVLAYRGGYSYYIAHLYERHTTFRYLALLTAFLEAGCGIWAAFLGCKVTCCSNHQATSYQAMYQGGAATQTVMILTPAVTAAPAANQGREDCPVHMDAPPQYTPAVVAVSPTINSEDLAARF